MPNTADIKAVITAEDRASSTLKKFGDNVGDVGSSVSKIGNQITHSLEIAGTAVLGFAVLSVKAFSESEDLIAQTNAVLKSTGGIAGVTADQVTKLATAWQKQSKFSDEAVRGAENILLTFTNITKDIFPQTTQAVLDISTALHEDLQSAAIQVGKALQDPVLGVTALRRVGVNFSDKQRDVIKALVDTGQAAQAQQIILAELNKEFGGSAKAAGDTFSGSLAKLKNSFNDLQESLGKMIVESLTPYLQQIANYVSTHGPQLQAMINTFIESIKHLTIFLREHGKTLLEVFVAYKALRIVGEISVLFSALGKTLGVVSLAFKATEVGALASRGAIAGSLATLGPYGLAIGAVAAAGFGLYKIYQALHRSYSDNLKDVQEAMNITGQYSGTVDALVLFTNALHDAQNRAKDSTAQITALQQQAIPVGQAMKDATQRVADAQTAVNNALSTYGQNSPQYVGAVASLRSAQDDLNSKTNTGIGNALNLILQKGRLRDANNQAAQASANLAGWQDIVNGKLGSGIFLAGQLTGAILGIAPAISSLQGSIANLQRNVGAAIQSVGSLQFQAQSGFSLQGARAAGGPVDAGGAYLVGENGPEIIVPNSSGTVIPNNKLSNSSGSQPLNISFSGIFMGSEQEFRKLAIKVFQAGADAASMQNKDITSMTTQNWRRV